MQRRRLFMKNRVILAALFFLSVFYLFGQNYTFPQNVDYPYGYQTSLISTSDIQNMYNKWKNKYLKSCSGMYRVSTDTTPYANDTRSEGMGYGMILSAYFGEKNVFDGLLAFYKSKRRSEALNLMAWDVTCTGFNDYGSATDGDLDVAFALIVASVQWGGSYFSEANSILTILKSSYFATCGGNIYTLHPGYNSGTGGYWGGCNLTDISYYTPAYFKVFAELTGDSFWYDVKDDAYTILNNGTNSSTGLVRDWQSYSGGNPPSGWTDYYRYDACRVPWRMALDYIWNGNNSAQSWCSKISAFANGIGASSIVDGYELDGTEVGTNNNSPFVGGFAVGGMCYSQSMVNSFASRLLWLDGWGYDNQYYNLSLRCLYALVLTGNFWDPLSVMGIEERDSLPEGFCLAQNYPNPFNTGTTIEYSIEEANFVRLAIYDVSGREVKTLVEENMPAGKHTVYFEATDLSPGVYLYKIEVGDYISQQKKMILAK
jgi:endo-1,4-beta-D-glucanase Y